MELKAVFPRFPLTGSDSSVHVPPGRPQRQKWAIGPNAGTDVHCVGFLFLGASGPLEGGGPVRRADLPGRKGDTRDASPELRGNEGSY